MLDILVSDNVVLEDFKRIHRVVDVMKAIEEETKMKLENERRKKRIDKDELDDPDIENVHNVNIQNPI
jgi:regulator of replication initiation timing